VCGLAGECVMKAKAQDFDVWFESQHGKRPGDSLTDEEMLRIIEQGDDMRRVYRLRLDWDNRRTSALYAWQLGDAAKAKRGKQ
jgi:hypothetical protein